MVSVHATPTPFVRDSLSTLDEASSGCPGFTRRLGPVEFTVHLFGDLDEAQFDHLVRYCEPSTWEPARARQTLYVAVGAGSPIGCPPPDWPFPIDDPASFHRTHWAPDEGVALTSDEQAGVWNLMDFRTRTSALWIRSLGELPEWEHAAPLRHSFHWAAHAVGDVVAHAAVWSDGETQLLVTGPGGSGKSTLSVAALNNGLTLVSEDLCWIELGADRMRGRRLYRSAKITEGSKARFPFIADLLGRSGVEPFEKSVIALPCLTVAEPHASISAVFCLSGKFADQDEIQPCGPALAYRLLAPSTLFLLRTAIPETAGRLKRLVEGPPLYQVVPGADPRATVASMLSLAKAGNP